MKNLTTILLIILSVIGYSQDSIFISNDGNFFKYGDIRVNANRSTFYSTDAGVIAYYSDNINYQIGNYSDIYNSMNKSGFSSSDECLNYIYSLIMNNNVMINDQTTRAIFNPFCRAVTGPYLLAQNTVPNSDTLILTDATGLLAGDRVGLFQNSTNPSSFFSRIVSISNDTVILSDPLDIIFDTALSPVFFELNCNINSDGSSTRIVYKIDNDSNQDVDITRIILQITDNTAMDDGTFGGITALTRGILLRKKLDNGTYLNYWNARSNAELKNVMFDITYSDKAPAGTYGMTGRLTFGGQEKIGVVIRLSKNEELQLLVQDDLSGLTTFELMAEGHFTDE